MSHARPSLARACVALFSARARTLLQYRAAALAGFGTQLFWGFIRVMIFEAFYRSSTATPPMPLDQVISYVWLGQATLALTLGSVDPEIQQMVRTGNVAYELLRPADLYALWYTRALAGRTVPMLLRALPMLVGAGLFLGLQPPTSMGAGAAWMLCTALAALLAASLWSLMNISLLWSVAGEGVGRFLPALVFVGSGAVIPLPFLPQPLRALVEALPFRGLADVPFRIYTGHMPLAQLPAVLAHQILWLLALTLFGRFLLVRAQRRMVVQGG